MGRRAVMSAWLAEMEDLFATMEKRSSTASRRAGSISPKAGISKGGASFRTAVSMRRV